MATAKMRKQIFDLISKHSPLATSVTLAQIRGQIDKGSYRVIVEDDLLIALGKLVKLSWYQAEISHVVVRPEFRCRGYGRRIVRDLCGYAQDLGVKIAQCTIRSNNTASRRLFGGAEFHPAASFTGRSGHKLDIWQKVLVDG